MSDTEFMSYEPRSASAIEQRLQQQLASKLSVAAKQVAVTMGLLADGATVPFIARYRK